uniref:Uncharacterized protein n=1 Tax=Trypanosoma congolense (strain IL3000) TaxID=1068625 RepID=G0UU42_TRYCI|nr:conserved hypothetical protein [Trypanosoma congolense IL3000]
MQRVPGEGTSTRKYFRKTLCSSASGSGLNNLDAPRTPVGHRLRNEEVPTFCDPELKEKMGMRSGTMSMGHFFANEVFGESDNTSDMNSFRIDVPCTPTVGVRRWHHQGRNDKLRVRIAGRKPIEEGILDGHEDTDEPSSSSSSASRGTETDGTSGDSSPDEDGGNDNIWGNVGKGKDDGDDGYDDDESATQPDSEDGKFTPRPRRWVPGKTCSDHSKSDPSMAQRYRYLSVEERVRIIKEERDRRLEGVRQKFVAMRANVVAPRPHTLVRVRMGGYKAIGFYGNRKTYENCALLAITANPAPLSRGITPERRSDRSNEKENKESPPRAVLSPAPRRPDSFDIKHSFREQKREQFGFKFIGENSRGSSASVLSIDKDD